MAGTYPGEFLPDQTPHILRPLGNFAPFMRGPLANSTSNYDELKTATHRGEDFSFIVAPQTTVVTPSRGLWLDGCTNLPGRAQLFLANNYVGDEVFFHVLFDAVLYNGMLVQSSGGEAVYETCYQTELRSRYLKYAAFENDSGVFFPRFDDVKNKSGAWFLLNNMLGNFGHFHIQSLSTIGILDQCRTLFGSDLAGIISTSRPGHPPEDHEEPFRMSAYERFGVDKSLIWNPLLEEGVAFKFDVLIVPSTHRIDERLAFHPYQTNVIRSHLVHDKPITPGKRILLSRADMGNKRSVANFDDLEAALRPLGFETLVIGSMPYSEQLVTLSDAEAVVGAHGGNLTNIMSHPGKLKILELFHTSQINGWFKHVAALCSADYYAYCVDPIEPNWYSSFVVDPALVAKCASTMLRQG